MTIKFYCHRILLFLYIWRLMKFGFLVFLTFLSLATYAQQDTSAISGLYNRILSLDEEIRNSPARQTSSFNPSDSASLPIGIVREIGNTKYIICIDSAYFTPDGAFFNVYMALDFPRADKKIAFAAKGIQFNPLGVSVANGARLQLVSQQVINLGPKTQMVFKNDGNNFIEFDCNGYHQAGLSVDFVFDSDFFENANDPTAPVKADMQLVVQDINDITFQLNEITPFKMKAAKDFVFHLQNVIIDQSDLSTPSNVQLSPQTAQLYPGGIESWKGFYAGNATVTLPQKLSPGDSTSPPMQIYAQHMTIDDSGLSGSFGANNLFSTANGKMNGKWGFSIENLQVDVAHNHVTGGVMSGDIQVPPLDDNVFSYSASISEEPGQDRPKYTFTVSADSAITLSAFKSSLVLNPSSQFTIQSQGDRFVPSATLNGSWTVDFSKAKFTGIAFQNLQINATAPYITSGIFSLVSNPNNTNLIKFPISISSVGMTQTPQGELAFMVGLGLNIGGSTVSFGVNTNVRVITQRQTGADGQDRFAYDRIAVDDIAFNIQTSPFHLQGVISVRNDDPVFGDLFFGSISLAIPSVLSSPILVSAGFGKLPEYKYWFTEAAVPLSTPTSPGIPIMSGIYLTSLYGGVQNRVASTLTDIELLNRVGGQINIDPNAGPVIPFLPDPNQGLTFRAGVGLSGPQERVFNGDVMLSLSFNPNGGFSSISFLGQAFMMVNRAQRQNPNAKKVWGNISLLYDHTNKVFDAGLNAGIIVPGTLTGGLNIALHIDTTDWYFWLNTPTNRAYLNLVNIFNVNTYFMVGTQIMPIPPPPSYVTNLVGAGSMGSIDLNTVGNGNGFATGMEFNVNFGGEFPSSGTWRGFVGVTVGGGFDIMLINVENATCSGSSDPVGVNGYYAIGQVYTYLNGGLGVRKYKANGDLKNEYSLGSLQVAALLQGKLPKPSFVYGAIGIQANVLGIIDFTFTADVEFGTNCTLVGI